MTKRILTTWWRRFRNYIAFTLTPRLPESTWDDVQRHAFGAIGNGVDSITSQYAVWYRHRRGQQHWSRILCESNDDRDKIADDLRRQDCHVKVEQRTTITSNWRPI